MTARLIIILAMAFSASAAIAADSTEQITTITNAEGVRIVVDAPSPMPPGKNMTLVFYALPNGNTIEQTIGKRTKEGDDWHFNIQHIGAQTRYLRNRFPNQTLVVAFLENNLKSWPTWRKKHGDAGIPALFDSVKKQFPNRKIETVLAAHSGGGSLIFGYLNSVTNIPDDIMRIVFLDSDYAYDKALHRDKFVRWLESSRPHWLVVLAYRDDIALLNGKTFVSAAGGTWGRTHLMKTDLGSTFPVQCTQEKELETCVARDRHILMYLRENPEKKIWHTVQVELNGFIHGLLAGTPEEGNGYEYLGKHVYDAYIH
ncbi:MAG: hypothetical protein JWO95_2211 [Verrucomicrobiales bacterium]|nr:hypothetical protein [Verrucomicrobiales bacterium]